MKDILLVISVFLVAAVLAGGCHLVSGPPPDVVATVDDEEISYSDHQARVRQITTAYEDQGGEVTPEVEDYIREAALDDLISETVLHREAVRWNVSISDRDVEEAFERFRGQFEDEEQARAHLQDLRMTEDDLRDQIRRQMKIEDFLQAYVEEELDDEEFEVSEEEVEALYEQYSGHMEDFPEYEDVAPMLRDELMETRYHELLGELVEELRAESDVEIKIDTE